MTAHPTLRPRPARWMLAIGLVVLAIAGLLLGAVPYAGAGGLIEGLRPSVMPGGDLVRFLPTIDFTPAAPISGAPATDQPWFVAPLTPRNALLVLHLIGLSIGFGSAIVLDAWLLAWMVRRKVSASVATLFPMLASTVTIGLVLLWISGLGFLLLYALTDPAKLANAKLYGKIGIVCVLTLNGYALHRWILPMTVRDVLKPLFSGLSIRARLAGLACGAVSGASWTAAFLLGILRELNGRISVAEIFHCWIALVLLAFAGANVLLLGRDGLRALWPARRVAETAGR